MPPIGSIINYTVFQTSPPKTLQLSTKTLQLTANNQPMKFQAQELTLLEDSPFSPVAAETFCYTPAVEHEQALGNLYLVVELSSEKSRKESTQLLGTLAQQIRNDFYRKTNTTPLAALRFALKKANKFLAEQGSINLSAKIIAAALKPKTAPREAVSGAGTTPDQFEFHLAKTGQATAIVLRSGELHYLLSPGLGQHTVPVHDFKNIVTAEINLSDTVLLATNQIHKLSSGKLKKYLGAGRLTQTLKADSAGLKNLALITLAANRTDEEVGKEVGKEVRPSQEVELPPSSKFQVPSSNPGKGGPSQKRSRIKIAILLALVVAVSAGAAITALKIKKGAALKKKEAEVLIKEVGDLKEKIISLLELNNKTEAAELTTSALEKLRRLEELGFFKTSRVTLEEELAKINRDLKRIEPINAPRTVVDLTANTAGFEPQGLSLGKNKIIVFGSNGFYKYNLNLRAGELSLLAESNLLYALENPSDPNQLWLLKNNSVITNTTAKNNQAQQEELLRANSEIGELKEMAYYGDALYVLNQAGLIYKLDLEVATSSNPDAGLTLWLNSSDKRQVTSDKIVTMTIDGAVYALTGERRLIKLQNGEMQSQTDLDESADQVVTEPDFDYIYLLSRAGNMILVMDKRDRTIKKRLSHPDLGETKSFAVDSRERTIYFLKDKAVYSFEL